MSLSAARKIVDADWWTTKGDRLAEVLGTVFTIVRDENEWRTDADEYHWGLYEGTGLGGVTLSSRRNMTYAGATLPDNLCKMSVDTLTAKVATIRPIPQVLTSRGNWKDQRRARKLRQFIEGEYYRQQIHEKIAPRIIKDALVSRAGIVHVFVDGLKPKVERVHSWTLFCDDWDAYDGTPHSMFRLRTMDRAKAIRKFGKTKDLAAKIKEAGRFSNDKQSARAEERASTVERVELLEAWYRCVDHDEDDDEHDCIGRHVIICDGAVLFDEEWPHDFFPFAILSYDTPNTGLWGTPLVQSLEGYQVSINEANEKLSDAYRYSGKGVITRDGAGIFNPQIANGLFSWQCRPGPYDPVVFDMDLVNEHMRARAPELLDRGLNAAGLSQMAVQSQKPAGIESGIALQTLDDVETQRHIVFGRRFETWCMDVARLLVECVKKIAKDHGEYAVKVPMRGGYLDLKWADVEIDGFQLQLQSVGQLYMSFAGRLEKLKTLFEMGAIDRGTFMRQLDAGDVQGELDLETADRLLVDEMLESMLDTKAHTDDDAANDYVDPHGYLPLKWAHRRAHQKRLQSEMEGAPETVLNLLGRFIDDLDYLIAKDEAKAANTNGVAPGALPMGAGPLPPPPLPPPGPGGGLDLPIDDAPIGAAPTDQLPPGAAPPIAA